MQHETYIEKQAQYFLMRLGISANYKGFHYISYGIYLSFEDPNRLLYVSKQLYPEIARRFGTDWRAVEHNMRTTITHIWKENARLLCFMVGYEFSQKPTVGKFLGVFYTFLLNQRENVITPS